MFSGKCLEFRGHFPIFNLIMFLYLIVNPSRKPGFSNSLLHCMIVLWRQNRLHSIDGGGHDCHDLLARLDAAEPVSNLHEYHRNTIINNLTMEMCSRWPAMKPLQCYQFINPEAIF